MQALYNAETQRLRVDTGDGVSLVIRGIATLEQAKARLRSEFGPGVGSVLALTIEQV